MNSVSDSYLFGHNHIKGCWEYHFVWCLKYRYKALGKPSIQADFERILFDVAGEHGWKIVELAVLPDHVHVIIRSRKPEHPSRILFFLKGRSSYELFRKHPNLRLRYPKGHLFSRGKFGRTIGVDIEVERRYVRGQKDIHQRTLKDCFN
jgi:putative transposase